MIEATLHRAFSFLALQIFADFMRGSLIPSSAIFVNQFYKLHLFPVVVLHDVASLYGFDKVTAQFAHTICITQADKDDKLVMFLVWFRHGLECDGALCKSVVTKYKAIRGSVVRTVATNYVVGHPPPAAGVTAPGYHLQTHPNNVPYQGRMPQDIRANMQESPAHAEDSPSPTARDNDNRHYGNHRDESKKANYVQQMFKDNKFGGDLSQDILETLNLYAICARKYSPSQAQKADFFVHVLDGSIRMFFFEYANDTMSYSEIVQVMLKEYANDFWQLQVKGMLETLRLRQFLIN